MKLYRLGIENRGQSSLQQSEQSVSYLRQATRIDPDFAEAWGALAWGYRALLAYGPRPDVLSIEAQCRSAAKRALALDPDNVEAQSALVLLKPFYKRWDIVERGCRGLLERHPENSILQYNLAEILQETGQWRDAIPLLQAVVNREPFWPLATFELTYAMIAAGRIEEAEDLIDQASTRWPRRIDFWITRHRMLILADRAPEAAAFAADLSKRRSATTR
jgi:predicted Zn-dependent protease